ncbi:MAG TPA: (Fe-S)-binding protein, partial [Candidatus Sutterella merdavium]|nr:(Fe-S)-binding protein [Candidatus Sutterella merdavium]
IRPGFWNVPLWGEIGVYFVGIAAVAVLIWGIVRNWRLHRAAVSEPPAEKGLVGMLKSVFYQPKNLETTGGRLHTVLAVGFFFLFLGTALATLDWDIGHYVVGTQFLQGNVYLTYKFVLDMAGVAVLLALFIGAWRRYRKESKAKRDVKFPVAYVSLAVVVLTGFVVEGLRLAVEQPAWMHFSPVGTLVAKLFIAAGFTADTLRGVHVWLWTFHGLLSLAFIAAIPLTFYAHLYRTPAAVYRRKATTAGTLAKIDDIEEQESFGLVHPSDLTESQRFALDGCTECGRCDDVCPALRSGAPLSPRDFVAAMRRAAADPANPTLPGEAIDKDVIWSCTTCGACTRACPANIPIPELLVGLRRHLALEQGDFPEGLANTFENVSSVGNPWGLDPYDRLEWADGLDVPVAEPGEHYDILYWVGCAASYDRRARKIARSMVKILRASGVKFAVMREERCHGEFARRSGEEYLYQTAAQENIENFRQYDFERILAACPHCFNTLKNEYPAFEGGTFNVVSHSEWILEMMKAGKLKVKTEGETLAYHDPCFLARLNGIVDAPREVLKTLGADVRSPEASGDKTFCCGAGGGQMWTDGEKRESPVQVIRLEELRKTGAKRIALACPHCLTMLETARAETKGDDVLVDIAEIVADRLEVGSEG